MGFVNNDSANKFAEQLASLAKRAKTPMLTRTIDPDQSKDKFNLTLTGIDKMDTAIKQELDRRASAEDDREGSQPRMINSIRLANLNKL